MYLEHAVFEYLFNIPVKAYKTVGPEANLANIHSGMNTEIVLLFLKYYLPKLAAVETLYFSAVPSPQGHSVME